MFRVDLLSHFVWRTRIIPVISAALGKQRIKTKVHGTVTLPSSRRPFAISEKSFCKCVLLRSAVQISPKIAICETTSWLSQMHKRIQPIKCRAILWQNYFHTPHHSLARVRGEEELEEKMKRRKCGGRFSRSGTCSRGRTVSTVWCVVCTFSSPAPFAGCITL